MCGPGWMGLQGEWEGAKSMVIRLMESQKALPALLQYQSRGASKGQLGKKTDAK